MQMVDPSRLSQKALPAQTYIESLVADRKEFEATPNLKVPPNPRDLQIDYTSPTFSIPQKVKFRYRLDGYDRDWHEAGTRRQAFYTDLPPGKYSFRVIASNSDGVWNDSAAKLDFSVAPAYYQTNWFRALCAVAVFGTAVGGLPVACAAIASSVRDDAGCAGRRAHTHCAGSSRHSAAKLPWSAAPLPNCFQLLPERPIEAKEKLEAPSSKPPTRSPKAGMRCRDCAIPQSKRNDLALAISTLGEELASDSSNHRPAFRVAVEGSREICIPSFATRSTKLLPKRCATPFVTLRRGRSRLKSAMTMSNSDCACGMTEKASIRSSLQPR